MRAQKKCLNTHSTKINMKSRHQIYLVVYPHTAEWDENIKRQKNDVKKRSQTAEKNHIILHSPRGNKNWKPFMHRISTLLIADRYEASNKYWRDKLWIQCSQRDISEQKNLLDRTNQYYTLAKRQEENWHYHITQQQTPTLRVMTASAKEICRHQSEAQFPIESKIVATKKAASLVQVKNHDNPFTPAHPNLSKQQKTLFPSLVCCWEGNERGWKYHQFFIFGNTF